MDRLRLIIIDDDALALAQLMQIFGADERFLLVAAYQDAQLAEEVHGPGVKKGRKVPTPEVDVAIIDLDLPRENGIDLGRRLMAGGKIRCLLYTAFATPEVLGRAIRAGFGGVVTKDTPAEVLRQKVLDLHAGMPAMGPEPTRWLMDGYQQTRPLDPAFLSAVRALPLRYREVLDALLSARSYRLIARELHISEATLRSYVSHILRELDLGSRTELLLRAVEAGYFDAAYPGQMNGGTQAGGTQAAENPAGANPAGATDVGEGGAAPQSLRDANA